MPDSPFLLVPVQQWVASNALAFAILDNYPVSEGHTLVVTRRVVADFFACTAEEREALFALVEVVKQGLDATLHPDGYNVGFNAGAAAGQTVMHVHVHVIPRFTGDMDDPRGGVRHAIPSKGNYLLKSPPLATGGEGDPFSRHVLPLFARATAIDIVAAFVQQGGLDRIRRELDAAIERGASVRLITGDYMAFTQVSALELLLDLQSTARAPASEEQARPAGRLEARVVRVEHLAGRIKTFHPKAWRFEGPGLGVAFVGSSNLSFSALETGMEWNLRVERDRDAPAWARVGAAFEAVWCIAHPLDAAWIAEYAERVRLSPQPLPAGEAEAEELPPPDPPHAVQIEALLALREARRGGRRRALAVLATGLGKTWLAAFDYAQLWEELGRRPRLLFLAHRREILRQAALTWRRMLRGPDPSARVGWFVEDADDLDADLVFASVAKLARPEHRARLARHRFDYVVVDEVHHAAADSYRRILDALDPAFLLGLTATPDRSDSADIQGLFDDFVAFRAGIDRGIAVKRLVPFAYFGVKDDIDYANIPWRNRRFDPEQLALAAQTEKRMATLWEAWNAHPGSRTLVFCCSIAHARFVKAWLVARAVRVAAVYSEVGSDDRDGALADLALGRLDAVCAVDVFNEGVDVPLVDRVVMLRPTESGVVFLQQLGRGLRAAAGKTALTVIDFVGNHKVFLERLRTLLSLGTGGGLPQSVYAFLRQGGPMALPAGCSVDVEIEAKRLLERLFRANGADELESAYRQLRDTREERPRAGELFRMGYPLTSVRERHGSWFEFVRGEGDLTGDEPAFRLAAAFLRELETTEMTRSFKMVTLEALLEEDALVGGLPVERVATRSYAILRRSPELFADVPEGERLPDASSPSQARGWTAYWRRNPIQAWTAAKKQRRTWFRLEGDRLVLDLAVPPELSESLVRLVRELVDLRLAQYRRRRAVAASEGFVCRVTWNKRDPILALPPGPRPAVPDGEADVRLPDGSVWQFRFAKEFCNVARPAGTQRNQLPELLRGWFGQQAGEPGRTFQVRFTAGPDGLWVEPERSVVITLPRLRPVVAYPSIRAAAGPRHDETEAPEELLVHLPIGEQDADLVAVRVAGSSMEGGRAPLHDGDWALLRLAGAGAWVEDRVVLIEVPGVAGGSLYQLKRLGRQGAGWHLTSDNPDGPSFDATEEMKVIARLERGIPPEDLAPPRGSIVTRQMLTEQFGAPDLRLESGRYAGHLFLFLRDKGDLAAPDRVRQPTWRPRPGETAYVLAERDGEVRYLGVGRWRSDEGLWQIPEADFATWRKFGEGRSASRTLPEGSLSQAQAVVDALLRLPEDDRWLEQGGGSRARVLGAAQRGGLRLGGGDGGFAERTVSLTDLAWVGAAAADVAARGGLLDTERVNRFRYLDGTPAGSTRSGSPLGASRAGQGVDGVTTPRL